ncbi:MAG: undecaprenyldiphospho-muramoylpentapeptide beta-N-acetylglucosaminyltransferase [Nitrospiraceae bacterium]|nr:undecaprenyldiphospho-muramoylpentapeptide beta-N-acetylglucosaminyltransferase [Nitrospiraceae bacterium]
MRVVIAGGGSGGHLFPGLALAEELKKQAGAEIVFMGTEKGLEAKVVPQKGYQIIFLPAEGVAGKSGIAKYRAVSKLMLSVLKAKKLLASIEPDVVVGTGGYVSVSPVVAAWLSSIPIIVMEQNVVPGAANRWLARLSGAVAATYMESTRYLPKGKTFLTGNPVRAEVLSATKENSLTLTSRLFELEPEGFFTVFVSGGSSGATSINRAVTGALEHLDDLKGSLQFLHQSGHRDYQAVREAYRRLGYKAMVVPFVYQMPEAYAAADLVICRAGATTLAELTALGKPAVLVPYPYAGAHQEFNAKKLEAFGAARLIMDNELSGQRMAHEIRGLFENGSERDAMAARSQAVGQPDAAKKTAELVLSLVRLKRKVVEKEKNVQAV